MTEFDVIVIGTGAGAKLIRPIANLGQNVAVVEHGNAGGTCLNHGCIPSKMLIHPADVIRDVEEARKTNVLGSPPDIDWAALVRRTTETVDHDSNAITTGYTNAPNVTYFPGTGRFINATTIEVNGTQITGKRLFIAAGVRARIPTIPGLAETPYLTHKEALRSTKRPRSITIIGGGFIALELGHFYASAGVRTVILSRSAILKDYDGDVRDEFLPRFRETIQLIEECDFQSVSYNDNQFYTEIIHNGTPRTVKTDQLLVAAGMIPNTDILNVEAAGIAVDDDGFITVNDRMATSVPNIWAFGDIIGAPFYRHKANFEGDYLFNTLYEMPRDIPISYPEIPSAIFTYPQIAGFGPSESELRTKGIDFVVGKCPYIDSGMGMAYRSDYGFIKLIFERTSRKLVSAVAIGPQAATMMHMPIAFRQMNATLDDMLSTIYIHPALPELVRNAARRAKLSLGK
ncbi:dihydrolipoyl dehydrogenase [bacterium]|nr:dihydrolipoyl dehydrogenase [bacterium]